MQYVLVFKYVLGTKLYIADSLSRASSAPETAHSDTEKCPTCAKFKPRNKKEPLMPHDVPDRPRSKIGADIFFFCGRPHLVVVDYFSKYPEVCRLQTSTAGSVVEHLKPIYARHGTPDILVADNMPFALGCGHLQQNGTLKLSQRAKRANDRNSETAHAESP